MADSKGVRFADIAAQNQMFLGYGNRWRRAL